MLGSVQFSPNLKLNRYLHESQVFADSIDEDADLRTLLIPTEIYCFYISAVQLNFFLLSMVASLLYFLQSI